jgi:hypothetical protein
MIISRTDPKTQIVTSRSLDVTQSQLNELFSGANISKELKHLVAWERDFLIKGIIPKSKMTEEEYFKGYNYKAFCLHRDKKLL